MTSCPKFSHVAIFSRDLSETLDWNCAPQFSTLVKTLSKSVSLSPLTKLEILLPKTGNSWVKASPALANPNTVPTPGISIGATPTAVFIIVPPILLSTPSESKKSYLFHLDPSTVKVSV